MVYRAIFACPGRAGPVFRLDPRQEVIITNCLNNVATPAYHYTDSVSNIQKVDQIKDLGILYDSHLTFKDYIQEKVNKAYSMIGLIERNFIHMDSRTFIMLYKALVRPHVVVSSTRGNINCKTTAFITTFENFLLLHE